MIWMALIALVFVLLLWWGLRHYGRQGALIAGMLGTVMVGGAAYLYWALGAYEMAESTAALNALPDREQAYVVAQAAQDEFLARNREPTQDVINLFQMALELDPNQVTALGSLGIIAFESQDYGQAITLWSRMLGQLPPESEQANAISIGIARATQRLEEREAAKAALPAAEITVDLALSSGLPASMQDATVFVFAREVGGAPRPVAARRIAATELPLTLTLSSADALMGGRLYQGLQVELQARMTTGDASGTTGDWFSESRVLTLTAENAADLMISPPTL